MGTPRHYHRSMTCSACTVQVVVQLLVVRYSKCIAVTSPGGGMLCTLSYNSLRYSKSIVNVFRTRTSASSCPLPSSLPAACAASCGRRWDRKNVTMLRVFRALFIVTFSLLKPQEDSTQTGANRTIEIEARVKCCCTHILSCR